MNMIDSFCLTDEQQVFIDTALEGRNILVDACIGSGKTTAIQQLCCSYPDDKRILYLTYNKLLKKDAKSKIKNKNATVTNYHGYAASILKRAGVSANVSDMIQTFIKLKPNLEHYDILVLDEYQDIDLEISKMLEYIKLKNPQIQIVAVGDMQQKIYDKTTLNVKQFIDAFLENYISLEFTRCFRLCATLAEKLGRIWKKKIVGVNDNCIVEEMDIQQVAEFLSQQEPKDILCLGSRNHDMTAVLNQLEQKYPDKFNKKTVFASISESKSTQSTEPKKDSAIFTTYDSSKGLERKICIIFDYTESYWQVRISKPQQSYEILRNIFCVAASRGKDRIIFVKSGEELLSESTLSQGQKATKVFTDMAISKMFDFKYKENVEHCFSLLNINRVVKFDSTEINIKNRDEMIDLSPCIGLYQESVFFSNHNIDLYIESALRLNNMSTSYDKNLSLDEKILLLTAIETNQNRYKTQVSVPFVLEIDKDALVKRLETEFKHDERIQVECKIDFAKTEKGNTDFSACGYADVVKNGVVYELKFVSELSHEHFLQCACYMVALGLEKGVLWNTRKNEQYEISIPNTKLFLDAVTNTITKNQVGKYYKPVKEHICVVDTETNNNDKVMSIGIVIADKDSFEEIERSYYILQPESRTLGMYSGALYIQTGCSPITTTRSDAIERIKRKLEQWEVKSIFAYNASFDKNHLYELSRYRWIDIMRLAANKKYNKSIPQYAESYNNGRLKRDYGVEPTMRRLSGNSGYRETHNAVLDAVDELRIMKLLGHSVNTYYDNAIVKDESKNKNSATSRTVTGISNSVTNSTTRSTSYTSSNSHAQSTNIGGYSSSTQYGTQTELYDVNMIRDILGISKSSVYKLIHNGELPAKKVKNKYLVEKKVVLDYVERVKARQRTALIAMIVPIAIIVFFWLVTKLTSNF